MSSNTEQVRRINRREAIHRVSALLGGVAFGISRPSMASEALGLLPGVGGLLAAVEKAADGVAAGLTGSFTAQEIAFLDEIAETILPATKTPGAKAAKTGAFMALMVTDSYWPAEQKAFREGMRKVDEASQQANKVSFM